MQLSLTFVFFQGCPNATTVRDNLMATEHPFTIICQDELPENHPMRLYSSPSILLNGELLFGSNIKGSGCSLDVPSTEDILTAIQKRLNTQI